MYIGFNQRCELVFSVMFRSVVTWEAAGWTCVSARRRPERREILGSATSLSATGITEPGSACSEPAGPPRNAPSGCVERRLRPPDTADEREGEVWHHHLCVPCLADVRITCRTVSVRSFPSACNTSANKGTSFHRGNSSVCREEHFSHVRWWLEKLVSCFYVDLQRKNWQLLLLVSLETAVR